MVGGTRDVHLRRAFVLSDGGYFKIAPVLVEEGVVFAVVFLFTVKAEPGHLVVWNELKPKQLHIILTVRKRIVHERSHQAAKNSQVNR